VARLPVAIEQLATKSLTKTCRCRTQQGAATVARIHADAATFAPPPAIHDRLEGMLSSISGREKHHRHLGQYLE
jgi:hypothetical protein